MKKEEIVLLKEKYKEIKKRYENKKRVFERIHELEETESVKEYIKLLKEIDPFFDTTDIDTFEKVKLSCNSEKGLIFEAFSSISDITNTEDIWVYKKTGIKNNDIFRPKKVYDSKYYDNNSSIESVYKNIETNECVWVPTNIRDSFEKSHNLLIDENYNIYDYFYDIQYLYLKNILEYGNDYTYSDLIDSINNDKLFKNVRLRKRK